MHVPRNAERGSAAVERRRSLRLRRWRRSPRSTPGRRAQRRSPSTEPIVEAMLIGRWMPIGSCRESNARVLVPLVFEELRRTCRWCVTPRACHGRAKLRAPQWIWIQVRTWDTRIWIYLPLSTSLSLRLGRLCLGFSIYFSESARLCEEVGDSGVNPSKAIRAQATESPVDGGHRLGLRGDRQAQSADHSRLRRGDDEKPRSGARGHLRVCRASPEVEIVRAPPSLSLPTESSLRPQPHPGPPLRSVSSAPFSLDPQRGTRARLRPLQTGTQGPCGAPDGGS